MYTARRRRRRLVATGVTLSLLSGFSPQLARAVTGSAGSARGVEGQDRSAGEEPPGPLVSVSQPPGGTPDDRPDGGDSSRPCIAATRPDLVAFVSEADDLTADDGNGHPDAFVNDRGTLTRLSQDPPGARITDVVAGPCLSRSGDRAVIGVTVQPPGSESSEPRVAIVNVPGASPDLLPPAPGGGPIGDVDLSPDGSKAVWTQGEDIYVHSTGSEPPGSQSDEESPGGSDGGEAPGPTLVSKDPGGQPTGGSAHPDLSEQGRCVVFSSVSPNLTVGDTNGTSDVFLATGVFTPGPTDDQTVRISRSPAGGDVDGPSTEPSVSADCSRIVFTSWGTNVVPGDTNGTSDIYVYDVPTGVTTAVIQGAGPSVQGAISPDGGYVAGTSAAPDLVAGDTNGGNLDNATSTSFQVIDRHGRPTYSTSIVAVDGPRVRVGFPPTVDLNGQSGGSVDGGALIDHQVRPLADPDGRSNTNPPASLAPIRRDGHGELLPPNRDITDGPDLVSAEVVTDDNGTPQTPDDDVPVVRYCFDEAPHRVLTADGGDGTANVSTNRFGLGGYNSAARVESEQAGLEPAADTSPPPCVRARFSAPIDVSRFTFATVAAGTVLDAEGNRNPKGSTALGGHAVEPQPGDITGPNLRAATVDFAAHQVTYTFDDIAATGRTEPADAATRFLFVDRQGTTHSGASVTAVDPEAETVTVAFTLTSDNLVEARRFVTLPDAVHNAAGEPNVEQSTDGDVTGPELVAVNAVVAAGEPGPPRFDFTFNRAVTLPDAARFALYTRDGTRFPIDTAVAAGPAVVRVEAASLASLNDTVVLGLAEPRAVFEVRAEPEASAGAPNPLGAEPVSGAAITSTDALSDGPDLVSVEFLPDLRVVDFVFDEAVRDPHLVLDPHFPDGPTDVFVVELQSGDILRASVDNNDGQLSGTSSSSQPSDGGRYVVFVSADLVSGVFPSSRQIWRRDLLRAVVTPGTVDFGALVVGAASEDRRIEIANEGFGRLEVGQVALSGEHSEDFRIVETTCSGRRLKPGQRCALVLMFKAGAEGLRTAEVRIDVNAVGRRRRVTVEGRGKLPPPPAPPVVKLSPEIGPPGTVALVAGQGFAPVTALELRWASPDAGVTPLSQAVVVTTDAAGNFGPTPFLAFPRDVTGRRILEVRPSPGVAAEPATPTFAASATPPFAMLPPAASVPFLVVRGTAQPAANPLGLVPWPALPAGARESSAALARTMLLRRIQLVERR